MIVSHVIIRDARPGDHDAIRELTLEAYAEYATTMTPGAWNSLERAVHAALDGRAHMHRVVAEHDGRVVGSVLLYPPASDASIVTPSEPFDFAQGRLRESRGLHLTSRRQVQIPRRRSG